MTDEQFDKLVQEIRDKTAVWIGDEACEKIERLINHAYALRAQQAKARGQQNDH